MTFREMDIKEVCAYCHHNMENHTPDMSTGRTDCDFPGCNCHGFMKIEIN